MDFPIGSISALILLILLLFQVMECRLVQRRILLWGLVGILLGGFLNVTLPAPKGVEVELNVGQTIMPVLLALTVWLKLSPADKYHTSVGTLAVGLLLYGLTTLLDVEPGLMYYPLIFAVPLTVLLALLTAKSLIPATLAMIGGSVFVVVIRYMEINFLLQARTVMDLPGPLIWNTTSLGIMLSLGAAWSAGIIRSAVEKHRFNSSAEQVPLEQGEEILSESCDINLLGEEHENNL